MKRLLVAFAFLAGCATQQWAKNGSSAAEFEIDSGQCNAQAYSVSRPAAFQQQLVYNACMRGKGWTLTNP